MRWTHERYHRMEQVLADGEGAIDPRRAYNRGAKELSFESSFAFVRKVLPRQRRFVKVPGRAVTSAVSER